MMPGNGFQGNPILSIENLSRSYVQGGQRRVVLDDVDITIEQGEFFVLLGKSGSGKSTLLNLISGIDKPDPDPNTAIFIDGTDITQLGETDQTVFRRDNIGIVFQFFNLIPTLTVLENITLPLELRGANRRHTQERAQQLLEHVGLGDRAETFPDKLSGGEQQRVAIARALVHEPKLVLADEPTGNLDEENSNIVLNLLVELTKNLGKTLIMATHSTEVVPLADRVCRIHDGKLVHTRSVDKTLVAAGR
jgi:putative ABC transport system ATP-binding protein